MDSFCKTCLGLIVLLLSVIALRPVFVPQSASAQAKKLPSEPQRAGASTTVWKYNWSCIGGIVSDDTMTTGINDLNAAAKDGWELVTAFPVAGFRNDNAAMGTVNVCFIARHPL